MHFGSYTISVLLHLALALVIFYWPSSPPIKLDQPMMQISINMGAPGGNRIASPVLGPQGKPSPSQATSRPTPQKEAAKGAPIPREDVLAKAEPQKQKAPRPQPREEAVPIPEKPAVRKNEPKKDDEPDEKTEKPKEKPKEKQDKNKEATRAKASETKKPGRDPLAEALADAARQNGARGTKSRGKDPLAGALADFEKSARSSGAGGGGGGEGDGPGGGGIYDVYMGQVILAIRPNWSMPTYSRQNFTVRVRVKVAPNGEILNCSVEHSSGRAEVDASAVKAVIRTKMLPPPPTPEQQDLSISFNTQEMGGR